MLIEDNARVLFQGDSITDCGRDKAMADSLGNGYAFMVAGLLSALYPEKRLTFLNRGVGGNRIVDLQARWQTDCLDLHPTWVSVLIGINDTWRRYDSSEIMPLATYEAGYRDILTRASGQGARLILGEPFVLPYPADRAEWREDLDPRIHVVRALAREYNAILLSFDSLFAVAATRREPEFWAGDGVHPTLAGHALMAHAWLRAVEAL